MINLCVRGTNVYAIGVQNGISPYNMYFRCAASDGRFAWYQGGVHTDGGLGDQPGGGTTMMYLDSTSALSVPNRNINGNVNSFSDRNIKENFTPIDPLNVLAKVVALPITGWNFNLTSATGPRVLTFFAGRDRGFVRDG